MNTQKIEIHLLPKKDPNSTTKPDYSAESLVVEKLDTIYRYSTSGMGSREISAVTLIQSDAAARQYSVLTIPFAGDSQRVEVEYVRVKKPDGTTVETPAADAQEMPQEVTRQAPFYSDLKEKQIPIRNLQVGDRLEYKARIVDTKAEIPGKFWGQESYGSWAVILNESIELHVPKAAYVKVWSPEHPATKIETSDEVVYRWNGSQLDPTVGKDGKAVQKEIDPKGELPTMAWTAFKSWEELGAWYRQLEEDRIVPDATVKAKALELTAGEITDAEKTQALYSFVATQIRYIGVAFGVGRYQPHPAAEVLRNQYGDCKDKHTLLAAMLTAVGLHPEAALIGAGVPMNEEVPSPAAFNHMITRIMLDGAPVWLDSTSELAPYRMLVPSIRDKRALVVPASGNASLAKTPVGLPFKSFSQFTAKGTLAKDGTMKAQIALAERGDDELLMRTLLRQVPRGQWNELIQRLSQGIGFGGTTSDPDASRPDLTADPLKLSYNYEREKTGDWENHKIVNLFPIVFLPQVDDKHPPKKIPIQLGEPRVEACVSIIQLPDGWGAELPEEVHQKASFANFDKTYKIEGRTLTAERRIEILQREIPATEWKSYKKWFDATVSEGEPFTQLITTAADQASIKNSDDAAGLVRQAYEQIERGENNAAETTLDKAKRINEKQPSLWSTYGYLNFQRRNWSGAVEAYKKEIALNPDTLWVYRAMAEAQINNQSFGDATETLRTIDRRPDATDDDHKRLAALLLFDQRYEEVVPILRTLSEKSPEDEALQAQLGTAQLKSGKTAEGEKTLIALLNRTSDVHILNSAAYDLSNTKLDLDLAEKSAKRAIDDLTAESKEWGPDAAEQRSKTRARQALLIAAWDTLGWIYFQQGRLPEAESYLQAAWKNDQSAEVGLHLGELAEKQSGKQAALHFYQLAFAKTLEALPEATHMKRSDAVSTELKRRIETMKKQGVASTTSDLQSELSRQRTIRIGPKAGEYALLVYTLTIEGGKIVQADKTASDRATVDEDAMVKRANLEGWVPRGSAARMVRQGTLNCHNQICELVMHPL